MNIRAEIDIGPLTWVKGEIDQSLERALEALKKFAASPVDAAQLKSSQTHLHQAHGALQIVGLDGVTRVSEELESFLANLERETVPRNAGSFAVAERGFSALSGYLDQLINGAPNQPLKLYGVYHELLAARGGESDPSDLYFPDLSQRPPRRAEQPVQLNTEEAPKYYRDQRGKFQRGLLKWIKKDAAGAQEMREAMAAIESAQQLPSQRAFWWVATAFCDALIHNALPAGLDAKRMCTRIEQQLKRLIEGSQNVAERLMREALYFVAQAKPASELLREVREAYALEGSIPEADGAKSASLPEQPLVRSLHEQVAQAKDAWNKYAAGHAPSLPAFRDLATAMKERAAQLPKPEVAALAREIAVIATWLAGNTGKMSEAIGMEVATALLLFDNALENYANVGAEFVQQAQLMGARLKACVLGKAPSAAPEIPLLDEMSRRAQEKLVMHQVVGEIQTNLRAIEQALDAFFRDPAKRGELGGLDKPVRQVLGALAMMGEKRAAETLGACQKDIARFVREDYAPQPADFERVAQSLSGLGFYIEALGQGKADFDLIMQPIKPRSPETEMERTQRMGATVEAELEQEKKDAATLFEAWREKPGDSAIKQELRENLEAIQKDAGLVADSQLSTDVEKALTLLDKTGALPLAPLASAIENIAPAADDAPSPEAAKLIDASAETVDAELLAIYLEEAEEVLATISTEVAASEAQPQNQEALTTIRRGFHTLKGSGRMVGLTRLGEGAWAVEQAMNLWLQDARAATPDLLHLIREAHEYFRANVERLKAGGHTADERALVALAEKVKAGEPLGATTAAPVETPPAAAEMPAIEMPAAAQPEPPALDFSAAPPQAPAAEPPPMQPAPVAASASDEPVIIGETAISASLYSIFLTEADAHLMMMNSELEMLRAHGVVTDAFLRAAHTMAGIAGTIRIDDMRDLGYALEHALQQFSYGSVADLEQDLIEKTVRALTGMQARISEHIPPDAAPELIERLGIAAAAAAQAAQIEASAAVTARHAAADAADIAEAAAAALAGQPVVAAPAEAAAPAAEQAQGEQTAEQAEDERLAVERRQRRLDDDLDQELLPVFLEEAAELVPAVGTTLRDWRADTANNALGQNLQRVLHTLKGGARMAGAMALGELTHHMETRIENALQLKIMPAALFDDLETSYDRMGLLYDKLQRREAIVAADMEEAPALEATPATQAAAPAAAPVAPAAAAAPAPIAEAPLAAALAGAVLRVRADVVDRLVNQAGEVSIARSRIEGEVRSFKAAMQELTDNMHRLRAQLREIEIQAESQMQSQMAQAQDTKEGFDALEFDRFTRFQELTRMMAESVSDVGTVHQNLLNAVDETDAALAAQARMSRDLQQDLMRVRMVPFSSISERLYRIVRQTAKELNKRANLDIRGGQVEMDRSVLERITAPFEHLLRNSLTHGLEPAAERAAKGKAEIGEIRLDLRQDGNDVVLTLSDDGAGLNIPRIRAKAVSQGLMREDEQLSDAELAEFIFRAGFSTATEITQIAGRGVGMDVVKNEITALGGRVELKTEAGKGAKFTIYLPLTLAVTQAVLVRAGGRSFAVPAVMVEQVMQMRPKDVAVARAAGYAEHLGRRYTLSYLTKLLHMEDVQVEPKRTIPILFTRSGIDVTATEVDEMIGNQEIVVKNVGPQIAHVPGITGATVLGTGEIVLILNPVVLAGRSTATAAAAAAAELAAPAAPVVAAKKEEERTAPLVMVVDDSLTVRKITGRLLQREGYLFVTAKDGVDAVEQLQEIVPDVMLVDIEMPRMDGFDLARNVRADAKLKHIPIIMITSRTADKHRDYAKEIGVNVYLGKPYQEDELLGHIAGFVKDKVKATA